MRRHATIAAVNRPDRDPATLDAPHFAGGRFFNPWGASKASFADVFRWKVLSRNRWDKRRPPVVSAVPNDGARLHCDLPRPELTWVGHATFAVQSGRRVLLTDPHFGPRALLPPRLSPLGLPLAALPADAVAVLSHNHYDHLDAWTLRRLPKTIAWFVPLALGSYLRRHGFRDVVELDWWQSVERDGWRLTFLPAQHWSRRLSQRDETTLWGSWLIECDGLRLYFGGDSGYYHGFAEIGRRFPGIDLALLPIGAYEPRWFMRPVHMNPEEALIAFRDLAARRLVPMHWGAFDLTDEPVDEAPRVLAARLAGEDRDLAPAVASLAVGGTLAL